MTIVAPIVGAVGAIAASRKGIGPSFYVDSRDAVDDGGGLVASVTDRINGWVFAESGKTFGVKPIRNTTFLPGVTLIQWTNIRHNLIYSGINGFGGYRQPQSFVTRVRFTNNISNCLLGIGIQDTGAPNLGRIELQRGSTTSQRTTITNFNASFFGGNFDTAMTLTSGTWVTIGVSWSGTSFRIFENGVFKAQHTPVWGASNEDLGTFNEISLGNRLSTPTNAPSSGLTGAYYSAWKGWVGVEISDTQQMDEHISLSAIAA